MKTIIFSIFVAITLQGCFGGEKAEETWTALIYPDKNNTKRSKKLNVYKTLEECRKGALDELDKTGLKDRGDYKCGLNCGYHEGMKLEICEKLSK